MPDPLARLLELWADLADLGSAEAVLSWDQETYMPPKGVDGRGRALSTLAGLKHGLLSSDALDEAVAACEEAAEPGSVLQAHAREARRAVDRARKVPSSLAKALAEARSRGLAAWQRARAESDFSLFESELTEMVRLKREEAHALAPNGRPYDALLDIFEPGSTEAELAPLFDELGARLAPLVRAVADCGTVVDESPVQGDFEPVKQGQLGRFVAGHMGFDFEAGRLDRTAHPFCSGFNAGDVRITWRWQDDDLRPALYGIMHEAGHGLYEQGLPPEWQGTPIGPAVSLGVHESQSRLWENLVGRSEEFWEWLLPQFVELFPEKAGTRVDQIWPALHTVKPSLIRVEADEATYNLHVAARFRVERGLFDGEYEASDLPRVWDAAYEELLGIRAEDPADGVLQDIHWAMGAFGYFPTYTLGNLINAQLFAALQRDIGDQGPAFARGEFGPLLEWLREKIHRHGSRWTAQELVERATGRPLETTDFLRYIGKTTERVYGVSLAETA